MDLLALNFYNGENLPESFLRLAFLLHNERMYMQECFTYESACRIQSTVEDVKYLEDKILKVNEIDVKNSFEKYCLYKNPIRHEFPVFISDLNEQFVLNIMDRYMAMLHIMLLLDTQDDINIIKIVQPRIQILKTKLEDGLERCFEDFSNHVLSVVETAEQDVGDKFLKSINNITCLKTAIYYYPENSELYFALLHKYLIFHEYANALNLYNQELSLRFNLKKAHHIIDVYNSMINYLSSNKRYYEALRMEQSKAMSVVVPQGGQNAKA